MILSELIERIKVVATGLSRSPLDPRLLDSEVLIEVILPRVFEIVAQNAAKDGDNLNALKKDHSITFASGVGTLPEAIKEEFTDSISFPTIYYVSYEPRYEDFVLDSASDLIGTFTIHNRQIYYRPAGAAFGAFNGSVTVNAVTLPTLPTLISDTVVLKDSLLEEVISLASSVINGTTPLPAIGVDYPPVLSNG